MTVIDSHADLVFEGGGVKGIGLAGALATLEEREYRPQNIAGTSAGAITAALLSAGYSADELREIIITLDYRQFQDRAWEDKVPLIERSLSMLLDLGLYEGNRFLEWMRERLDAKGVHTFAERMSMSIPVFFEPVRFDNPETGETHVIVDGGMLSNFPVGLFDCEDGEPPEWPT